RAQRKRAAEARHVAAQHRGKVVIDVSDDEASVIRASEQTLVAARDSELPLMRDAIGCVRPVVDRPEWARERDGISVPTIAMLRQYDEAAARWLLDRYIALERQNDEGNSAPVKPDELAAKLLQNPLPAAPRVRGLITHPLVCGDGRLIEKPGLDGDSGLYLHLGGGLGQVPPTLRPAIEVPH